MEEHQAGPLVQFSALIPAGLRGGSVAVHGRAPQVQWRHPRVPPVLRQRRRRAQGHRLGAREEPGVAELRQLRLLWAAPPAPHAPRRHVQWIR